MDVHADVMASLQTLKLDVNEIADDTARACLTNFVDFCEFLYKAEADGEQRCRETIDVCRQQIFDTHKISTKVLENLLVSKEENCLDVCNRNEIMRKMQELFEIGEKLDQLAGKTVANAKATDEKSPLQLQLRTRSPITDTRSESQLCEVGLDKSEVLATDDEQNQVLTTNVPARRSSSVTALVNSAHKVQAQPISECETFVTAVDVMNLLSNRTCTYSKTIRPNAQSDPEYEGEQAIADTSPLKLNSSQTNEESRTNQPMTGDTKTRRSLPGTIASNRSFEGNCTKDDSDSNKHLGTKAGSRRPSHPNADRHRSSIDSSCLGQPFTGDSGATVSSTVNIASTRSSTVHSQPVQSSAGDTQKTTQPSKDKDVKRRFSECNPAAITREVVSGLQTLADVALRTETAEQEIYELNRKLSNRLEVLKQEAGSHPAIKVYTSRNCHSPLAAKARREDYAQYACALERVLKKIKKTTESLRSATCKDLTNIDRQVPALQTLSQALEKFHTVTADAAGSTDETEHDGTHTIYSGLVNGSQQMTASTEGGTLEIKERHSSSDEPPQDSKKNPRKDSVPREDPGAPVLSSQVAQMLVGSSALIGSTRRSTDASLNHIESFLRKSTHYWYTCAADQGSVSEGVARSRNAAPTTPLDVVKSPATTEVDNDVGTKTRKVDADEELLTIDTLRYLPLGDKECREHLLTGTELLMRAVEDLSRAVYVKFECVKAQNLVDSALCRPFPKTSTLRLELLRLLTPLEESSCLPAECTAKARSKSPKKSKGRNVNSEKKIQRQQQERKPSPEHSLSRKKSPRSADVRIKPGSYV